MPSTDVARLVLGYLSDQGLNRTISVFYQECPDLRNDDHIYELSHQGQKLSLIIEEYFVLKGHDKKAKDPVSILQLLWKQFDSLVGQLKHSTIHAAKEKAKVCSKVQSTKQGVRVRELNRQNRAILQKKNATKSVFIPNPDLVKVKNDTSVSCEEKKTPSYTMSGGNIAALGNNNTRPSNQAQCLPPSSICTSTDSFQPVTKSGVLQGRKFTESTDVSCNSSLMSSSSPKRKSLPPKRRLVSDVTSTKIPPSECSVAPTIITTPDENQLDLSSLVEKILGRPEFSEKLAENINRAVEIDIPGIQAAECSDNAEKDTVTSGALVDNDKIDNIVEMMRTQPAFEELFSSFESFNNSLEESDLDRYQNEEPSDLANQERQISSPIDNCASVATDALLLLANSPGISTAKSDQSNSPVFFQLTPKLLIDQTRKTVALSTSPNLFTSFASSTSSPVLLSPGKTNSPGNRTSQPIVSHVRQLDFSKSPSGESSGVHEKSKRNVVGYKNISHCSDLCEKSSMKGEESTESSENIPSSENEENSLSVLEELATHAFSQRDGNTGENWGGVKKNDLEINDVIFQGNIDVNDDGGDMTGHRRDIEGPEGVVKGHIGDIEGPEGDVEGNAGDVEGHGGVVEGHGGDIERHVGETEDHIGDDRGHTRDTDGFRGNNEGHTGDAEGHDKGYDGDLGGNAVENRAEDKMNSECVVANEEANFRESSITGEEHEVETASIIISNNHEIHDSIEECRTAMEENQRERKDIEIKTEHACLDDPAEDSKGCDGIRSVKEEPEDVLFCKVKQKSPVVTNTTNFAQVPKRKLKKNKKSGGCSKKRKTLPLDLDVDKFLSRLHYVEEKT